MVVDPFLLTHNVRHQLYDIGPRISPISIRDQMIRSYALVVRAIRQQIIGPEKPLLVVGAGAAGATAAMIAADRGVQTTLIERGDGPFSLQLGCHTRRLDPVVYDWPAEHWAAGEFPWRGDELPLHWEAGGSAAIGITWEELFNAEVEINPLLTVVHRAELENPEDLGKDENEKLIPVYYKAVETDARQGPFEFAMILSCIGAGKEKVELDNYVSESFWNDDSYADENLGLPGYMSPKILISGSGDGALQDFLRIVTKKESAKEIFQSLPPDLQRDAGAISSFEDHYQRAFCWSANADGSHKPDDCTIQTTLHKQYVELVTKVLDKTKYRSELRGALDLILRDIPDRLMITLTFECTHFSHCYPLNHFLVLLLATYIEQRLKTKKILFPDTRIVKLTGRDKHVCDKNNRKACEHQAHVASIIPAQCSTLRETETKDAADLPTDPFNVIVVRHGIDWNKPLFGELPKGNKRHMLPYYLGWAP